MATATPEDATPNGARPRDLAPDRAAPDTAANDRVMPDSVRADLSLPATVDTGALPWVPSPMAGVERRLIERDGGEVARATSLVRYAPGSRFPAHVHGGGEEFLVLEGVFSDESGDYGPGMYVRNPPGSAHAPFTRTGCTIFVKLRQMPPAEKTPVRRMSSALAPPPAQAGAVEIESLFEAAWEQAGEQAGQQADWQPAGERVAIEALGPGGERAAPDRGEEIFVLAGTLSYGEGPDASGPHGPGTWLRRPAGTQGRIFSAEGCRYWVKRGHLPAVSRVAVGVRG